MAIAVLEVRQVRGRGYAKDALMRRLDRPPSRDLDGLSVDIE
jgi:hypothetical protein